MTYMLVNAIKEQQAIIDKQTAIIEQQDKNIEQQRADLLEYKLQEQQQTTRLEQLERAVLALMENKQAKSEGDFVKNQNADVSCLKVVSDRR